MSMKRNEIPPGYEIDILCLSIDTPRAVKSKYDKYIANMKRDYDVVYDFKNGKYCAGKPPERKPHYKFWIGFKDKGQSQSNKRVTIR